jgi:hypothetical protein
MALKALLVAATTLLAFATGAHASIIPIGSALAFGGTNLPGACANTTCSDNVLFGVPATIDGGALLLSEQQVADGPNAEWDVWRISTTTGGPLAGNLNAFWNIVMSYDLSAPVIFDQVVNQWTVNAAPVNPLSNFSGICCASASNPSPIIGEAYYNSGFSVPIAAGVFSNWQQIFVNPYSFVSAGGINPSTANGFNFALHFTLQNPVPAPVIGRGLSGLLAVGGLLFGAWLLEHTKRRRSPGIAVAGAAES